MARQRKNPLQAEGEQVIKMVIRKDGATETVEQIKLPQWLNNLITKKWFLYLFTAVVLVLVIGFSLPANTRAELVNSVFAKTAIDASRGSPSTIIKLTDGTTVDLVQVVIPEGARVFVKNDEWYVRFADGKEQHIVQYLETYTFQKKQEEGLKEVVIPANTFEIKKGPSNRDLQTRFSVKSPPASILITDGNKLIKNLKITDKKISGTAVCVKPNNGGYCPNSPGLLGVIFWKNGKVVDAIGASISIGAFSQNFEESIPSEKATKIATATEVSFETDQSASEPINNYMR